MVQIPDAPWIREAETVGISEIEICCPVCGEECETIWLDANKCVCGCDRCMRARDAADWYQDEWERSLPG